MYKHRAWLSIVMVGAVVMHTCAQSSGTGNVVVEPLIGFHYPTNGHGSGGMHAGGVRVQWRLSYERSAFAAVWLAGSDEAFEAFSYRSLHASRHVLVSAGFGATVVDHEATGAQGLHLLLGFGWLRQRVRSEHTDVNGTSYDDHGESGPVASMGAVGELELTRRLLLRASASAYLGIRESSYGQGHEWWFPGVSIMAGLAASL